jgi:argininosuccinate lyase
VRGKAGRVIGRHAGWLATMKGLPSGYNKDLQEDKEALFDAEDTILPCIRACTRVISTLTLNVPRMLEASEGLLLATEVAEFLVGKGVPFRTAHEIVGRIVRALVATGRDFRALTLEEWKSFDDRFDAGIVRCLSAAQAVRSKKTPQSTAPDAVAAALNETRLWLTGRRT